MMAGLTERAGHAPDAGAGSGDQDHRAAVRLCWLALLNIGAYTALFGPVLPELARRTDMPLGAVGLVVTALALAAVVSTPLTGRAVDRYGARAPLAAALVLNGAALLALPWADDRVTLLAFGALLGAGDGGVAVATHVLVGRASRGDDAAALNRLNVFFGVGAIAGPAVAALIVALDLRAALLLAVIGIGQVVTAIFVLRAAAPDAEKPPVSGTKEGRPAGVTRSGRLWLLALLLFVYVGLELGLGAWAFTYARDAAGLSAPAAALLSGGFWGALTVGRLLSPLALRRLSDGALLVAGAAVSASGALVLLLGGAHAAPLIAGVLVVGVGFGPVWPVTFALAASWFPTTRGSASGLLAMASAAGAAGLPWCFGWILELAGPSASIAVTCGGCLILVALAYAAARASQTAGTPMALG